MISIVLNEDMSNAIVGHTFSVDHLHGTCIITFDQDSEVFENNIEYMKGFKDVIIDRVQGYLGGGTEGVGENDTKVYDLTGPYILQDFNDRFDSRNGERSVQAVLGHQ